MSSCRGRPRFAPGPYRLVLSSGKAVSVFFPVAHGAGGSTRRRAFGAKFRLLWHIALLASFLLSMVGPASEAHASTPGDEPPVDGNYEFIRDDLGRLNGVVDRGVNGQTVIYSYDLVGNLSETRKQPSSQPALIVFRPLKAAAGSDLTLLGTGFNPDNPADNVVEFTGSGGTVLRAAVNEASPTRLVVTVPSGTVSGPIKITRPALPAATSRTNFTVLSRAPEPPAITSISPLIGDPDTTITITGANFATELYAAKRVSLNNTHVPIISATATSLTVKVPAIGSSGRLRVSTPLGSAESSQDLFVLPPELGYAYRYGANRIDATARMAIGDTRTVTIGSDSHAAMVLFDAPAGQRIRLRVSNSGVVTRVLFLGIDGVRLSTQSAQAENVRPNEPRTIGPYTLPATGTYTILLESVSSAGSSTLTLRDDGFAPQFAPSGGDGLASPSDAGLAPDSVTASTTTATTPAPDSDDEWVPDTEARRPGRWRTGRPPLVRPSALPLQAAAGVTALAGQVLALDDRPLANVTLKVQDKTAQTDASGRFLLTGLPAGRQTLLIDGRAGSRPGHSRGLFEADVRLTPGETTALPYTIWLPQLDAEHAVALPARLATETVVTTPAIPGVELRLPSGQMPRDRDGQSVTQLGITALPLDRVPFPMPGVPMALAFTVQPAGWASVPSGTRLIFPNDSKQPPGTRFSLWSYNAQHGWHIYGRGRASRNGRQIVPDPGVTPDSLMGAAVSTYGPPDIAPTPGGHVVDGYSVDLNTGLFIHTETDLALPDLHPLALTRTYRPGSLDPNFYQLGVGVNQAYGLRLYSENPAQTADLILPDGGRVRYTRTTPGPDWESAVLEHTTSPTAFYKSRLTYNHDNGIINAPSFELRLRDGTLDIFSQDGGWNFSQDGGWNGALQAIRDRWGNQTSILPSFVEAAPASLIRSPNGHWLKIYAEAGLTRVQDNTGRFVTYEYTPAGCLWRVTDARGGRIEYTHEDNCRLVTIKNARGIIYLTINYDANGRVYRQYQQDGSFYQFDYTLEGDRVTETLVTDPRGYKWKVTFDDRGYPLTDTAALGSVDPDGQSLQQTTTLTWDPTTHLLSSVTNPLGHKTTYGYDDLGNARTITRLADTPAAATHTFDYEPTYSQAISYTNPLGTGSDYTTTFGRDSVANLTDVTDPLGHPTVFGDHTRSGLPRTVTQKPNVGDPGQDLTTTLTYDQGDLVAVTDPAGQTARQFVDGAGRAVVTLGPLGEATRIRYNPHNQPSEITDPLGGVTVLDYTANGGLTLVRNALQREWVYSYDLMDRVSFILDPLPRSESFEYDSNNNLTRWTDRKGQITTYRYDALNRLFYTGYGATGPAPNYTYQRTVVARHDAGDRVKKLTDTRNTALPPTVKETVYAYDDLARTFTETTPQLLTKIASWDAAGRLSSRRIGSGSPTLYGYDNAHRLRTLTVGDAVTWLDYDDADRRTGVGQPSGAYTYYGYGRTSQVELVDYFFGAIWYSYDASGRTARLASRAASTSTRSPPSRVPPTTPTTSGRPPTPGASATAPTGNWSATPTGHRVAPSGPGSPLPPRAPRPPLPRTSLMSSPRSAGAAATSRRRSNGASTRRAVGRSSSTPRSTTTALATWTS